MATHSSILAWRIHAQRCLVGYSPWGHRELDTTEQLHYYSLSLQSCKQAPGPSEPPFPSAEHNHDLEIRTRLHRMKRRVSGSELWFYLLIGLRQVAETWPCLSFPSAKWVDESEIIQINS